MTQFTPENKDIWKFSYMMMQPEYVSGDRVDKALEEVKKRESLDCFAFGSQ